MRYDLTDSEWSVVEPLLPMHRRGPKPKNNRQVLNGMFYILRTGAAPGAICPNATAPIPPFTTASTAGAKPASGIA